MKQIILVLSTWYEAQVKKIEIRQELYLDHWVQWDSKILAQLSNSKRVICKVKFFKFVKLQNKKQNKISLIFFFQTNTPFYLNLNQGQK